MGEGDCRVKIKMLLMWASHDKKKLHLYRRFKNL